MRILILGADGYLGWPTAMHFSALGHDVVVVDNYFRRNACTELDVGMLYPLPTLPRRAAVWEQLTGHRIAVAIGDLADPVFLRSLFNGTATCQYGKIEWSAPADAIIHYAEQPSAPYSLLDHERANLTLTNNLLVTNNLMFAVRDFAPQAHIVKLGTMGEYGTPNIDIEEGWLDVEHKGRKQTFLFPRQASSIYHTSKIMDTDLLWFGVRTWNLRVTDLMQGPVYGIHTDQTQLDERLSTIFNYDEIFGTVLNRFIVQAIVGYPLTVYGKGGQTRGYLNLKDTLQCVQKSVENPPEPGRLAIYNQIMETFSVNDLALKVEAVGKGLGYNVEVQHLENPRKEAEDHYYNPTHQSLLQMGVEPHYLSDDALAAMFEAVAKYKDAIRTDVIFRGVRW